MTRVKMISAWFGGVLPLAELVKEVERIAALQRKYQQTATSQAAHG